MIGFEIPSRRKVINRRFVSSNTNAKFGAECELNVLGNGDYKIVNISALNGTEGYIKMTVIDGQSCYVFIPFNSDTQYPLIYVGGGLPMDYGQGFNYAEIYEDNVWVDYNGIALDYTV